MASCEFIAIGDLHLNSLNNIFPNLNTEPNDLIYKALNSALRWARDNGIKDIILLGDVFENPNPSQAEQRRFLNFLVKNKRFNFYIIAGNHDIENVEKSSLDMSTFTTDISNQLDHVKIFLEPKLIYIKGVPFSFLPWPHHKTLQILLLT